MAHARVISEVVYNNDVEANQAKILTDFQSMRQLDDLGELPGIPTPNIFIGFLHDSGNGILQQINNDPNYGAGCILLNHDNEAEVPSQAEFDEIRNFLLTKLTENPPSVEQVNAAIGTSAGIRTRRQISDDLITFVKSLPVA